MRWPLLLIVMPLVINTVLASYIHDFETGDLSEWFFSASADASISQLEPGNRLLRIKNSIDGGDGISWYTAFYREGFGTVLDSSFKFRMYYLADVGSDDAFITCAVLYGDGSTQSTDAVPRKLKTNEWIEVDCKNDAGKAVKGVEISFWRGATGTFYFDDMGFYGAPGLTGAAVAAAGSAPIVLIALVVGIFSVYLVRR
jgi:hypothetical protein